MQANFTPALKAVLSHEGRYSNHPNDPGGHTMLGITLAVYRQRVKKNATVEDLKRLTPETVAPIYKRYYWDRVQGDNLPSGVDLVMFDFGVNAGPARSIRLAQAVVGADVDGLLGEDTMKRLWAADPTEFIRNFSDKRIVYYSKLSTWSTFGKGWTSRTNDIEQTALAMAAVALIPSTPSPAQGPWWKGVIDAILGLFGVKK